jgi:Uncharacterised nucleotidyltransferase
MTDRPAIQQLLNLRAWAIRVFSGATPPPVPEVKEQSFRVFLVAERCAGPLANRLGAAATPVMHAQALRDAQVVLAREAALSELARLGKDRGFPVVALKSSALSTRLPSNDLDVLVPEERLAEVREYLSARGFRGTHGYLEELELHHIHLPGRARPGEMTVEVHRQLGDGDPVDARLWQALRPLPAHPGCFRLPPERQAWHLLWHSVVSHPHRRGQLGDLLLIAEALGDLEPAARQSYELRVRAHPDAGPLGRALRMAEGFLNGTAPEDEFSSIAAARYHWRTSRALARLSDRQAKSLNAQWFPLADGGRIAPLWKRWVRAEGKTSIRPWLHAMETAVPAATRAMRMIVRASVFTLTLPLALRLSRVARADARTFHSGDGGSGVASGQ